MRLVKCHIENFGALSHYSADFSEGLTVIKEDNGFGKSTLAAFIKAMFYGLPKSRKSSLDENERLKFTPWQGGNFGGTLDFEVGDRAYRIERFFLPNGKENFKLYDLSEGCECGDYSQNIGVELFGLDAESFERSVYMKQSGPSPEMTVGLSAKLTDLVENSNDISSYDSAMDALKKRRLFYSTQNGAKGAVRDITLEIEELERQLADAETAVRDLEAVNDGVKSRRLEISRLEQKSREIQERIIAASDAAAAEEVGKRREELEKSLAEAESRIRAVKNRYPGGLPDVGLIEMQSENLKLLSEAEKESEILSRNTADREELAEIDALFAGKLPEESEIAGLKRELRRAEILRAEARSVKAQLDSVSETEKHNAKGKPALIILLAAVLLTATGIGLMFADKIAGVAVLAAGIVCAGIAGFVYLKNMISSVKKPALNIKELAAEYDRLTAETDGIERKVNGFVSAYFADFADVQEALDKLSSMLRDRERLIKSVEAQTKSANECRQRADAFRIKLSAFFEKYDTFRAESFSEGLASMNDAVRQLAENEPKLSEIREKLNGLPKAETAVGVNVRPEDKDRLAAEARATGEELDRLRTEASVLESRRDLLVTKAETLPETESELENKKITQSEYIQSLNVIDATIKLLETARSRLSGRYTDVMTKGFKKYAELLIGEDMGNLLIDTNLGLNLERYGSQKLKDYFSAGYKDMFDIAMRLALTDALYEGERPVLILDDPFVNMDDERVKKALIMLKKLATDRQIVYLTCHSSRCPAE